MNALRLGACVALAFLFGDMFGSLGVPSAVSVSSRVELLSYSSIVISMMSLMKTLDMVGREQRGLERERARRQYGALEYLLAKLVAELPLDALYAGASVLRALLAHIIERMVQGISVTTPWMVLWKHY